MIYEPLHFFEEEIEVFFNRPPFLEKKPTSPNGFIWRDQTFQIIEVLNEWTDYTRRGRMKRNMQPQHAAAASRRGSWGVGLFYFRVRTSTEQVFDLYYDRAPLDADHRKGAWFLYQELCSPKKE